MLMSLNTRDVPIERGDWACRRRGRRLRARKLDITGVSVGKGGDVEWRGGYCEWVCTSRGMRICGICVRGFGKYPNGSGQEKGFGDLECLNPFTNI